MTFFDLTGLALVLVAVVLVAALAPAVVLVLVILRNRVLDHDLSLVLNHQLTETKIVANPVLTLRWIPKMNALDLVLFLKIVLVLALALRQPNEAVLLLQTIVVPQVQLDPSHLLALPVVVRVLALSLVVGPALALVHATTRVLDPDLVQLHRLTIDLVPIRQKQSKMETISCVLIFCFSFVRFLF